MKSKIMKPLITMLLASMFLTGCVEKPGASFIKGNQEDMLKIPDYHEYVTLGQYKGLEYTMPENYQLKGDALDKELQSAITMKMRDDFADILVEKDKTDGADIGDYMNISYQGTIDGKPFDGSDSSADGEEIVIGYSGLTKEFEDALKGMKTGDKKEIKIAINSTVSDNSASDNSAPKEAVYTVTANKVWTYDIPELTDEIVKSHTSYETKEEYLSTLNEDMQTSYKFAKQNQAIDILLDQIIANSEYKGYPDGILDELVQQSVDSVETKAKDANLSVDDYLKKYSAVSSLEDYKATMHDQAETYMKIRMAACEIARQENITISEETFEAYKDRLREYYGLEDNADTNAYESDEDVLFECIMEAIQPIILDSAKEKE